MARKKTAAPESPPSSYDDMPRRRYQSIQEFRAKFNKLGVSLEQEERDRYIEYQAELSREKPEPDDTD